VKSKETYNVVPVVVYLYIILVNLTTLFQYYIRRLFGNGSFGNEMKLSVNIEIIIYRNVISTVLLCGYDTWDFHIRERTFDSDFLRKSAEEDNGVYAGGSNKRM
jgi:hypothetical protein